eukprot:scaffold42074_cov255-Skeletonema_dohrnii-CCMP3373.AAC.1
MMSRLMIAALLLLYASVADVDGAKTAPHATFGTDAPASGLRGNINANDINTRYYSTNIDIDNNTQDVHFALPHPTPLRSLKKESDYDATHRSLRPDSDNIIILSQPLSFQIIMSIILGLIAAGQIALLMAFYTNQSKRVLEFAQPLYV